MLTRREFVALAGAAAATGADRPKLLLVLAEPPEEVLKSGVLFRRAYSACPDSQTSPLLTGIFPHTSTGTAPLTRFFTAGKSADDDAIGVYTKQAGDSTGSAAESCVHVPLFIRYPKRLGGGVTSDILISSVDVLPTALGLAGLPIPDNAHGRDLSSLITGGAGEQPASVYAEGRLGKQDEWRMIGRGFDKMVTNARLETLHLFNLADDPTEIEDLAQEPGHRLRVDELRALMLDWRKRTGDGVDRSGLKQRRK